MALPPPPVQLPVSGRTLGRHVSLGPGWELNKEGAAEAARAGPPDYDQPSTSQQAVQMPEVSFRWCCSTAWSLHAG